MKKRIMGAALVGMMIMTYPSYGAFGGFRVGLGLGAQLLQGHHTYTGTPSPGGDQRARLSALSFAFGGHGGYLFELTGSKMVIGLEAYMLMLGASPTKDLMLTTGTGAKEGQVAIKHTSSMGIAATVGMMLNPKILVYLNVGLERATFTLDYKMTVANVPASQKFTHNFTGFTPGIGADYKISSHFLIGAHLSSPFWKRFKMRNAPLVRAYDFRPVERRLLIRLTYLL